MLAKFAAIPIITATLVLGGAAQPLTPSPRPVPTRPADPHKPQEKKTAEIGEEAPNFILKDQHGETHSLEDYKGKIVVLEWFNERCPVCNGVWSSGLIPKLMEDLRELKADIVYLTINSTADQPEEEILKGGVEFLEEMESDVPMLMDYDGKVGHEYGARTTPHMYVIDTEGILVYQGALSNDRRMKKGADAETHIVRAITQVIDGEEVSPSYVQPWGCAVKYAKGSRRPDRRPMRPSNPRGPGNPR